MLNRLEILQKQIDDAWCKKRQERPLIGISVNIKEDQYCITNTYIESIAKAGGIPLLIPVLEDVNSLTAIIDKIDGLILSGGGDLHPSFFNEEITSSPESINITRDIYDLTIIKLAADRQVPIFGICRGFQVLNVAFGGSIYQDIAMQYPSAALEHSQKEAKDITTQSIRIDKDSILFSILQKEHLMVNTFHHQALKDIALVFKATAWAEDGIAEAIESSNFHRIWGVQWHPEGMAAAGDEEMLKLFRHFVREASLFQEAKEFHKNFISIDSHTDTPLFFEQGIELNQHNGILKEHPKDPDSDTMPLRVSIHRMAEGKLDAVYMVAYLKQGARDKETTLKTVAKTKHNLAELQAQINKYADQVNLACSTKDIIRLKKEGKKAILMGIENAYGIGHDIENLSMFKEIGVTYITLSHNGHNDVCDSASELPEHNGLSSFGREVVKEMNRLGIMIDISHTSEKTSFDVLELSEYPIIASHSSAKVLCDHHRNISDELMKAIAAKGGVIQVCLYSGFIAKEKTEAHLMKAIDHINYIVRQVGIDHVGIGSDFDGGGGLPGLDATNELINITVELLRQGYSHSDIQKIWGGNLMRVMDCVQNHKSHA